MTLRQRFLQFSVRSLLLTMAVIALGAFAYREMRKQRALKQRKEFARTLEAELIQLLQSPHLDARIIRQAEEQVANSLHTLDTNDQIRLSKIIEAGKQKHQAILEAEIARFTFRLNHSIKHWVLKLPHDPLTSSVAPPPFYLHPKWGDN
jgi:hypothetical protein